MKHLLKNIRPNNVLRRVQLECKLYDKNRNEDMPHIKVKVGRRIYKVNIYSDRLQLFKSNCRCVKCGIEGNVMQLDLPKKHKTPHFNLYHRKEDGTEVLMTKDHIVPKIKGGKNHISNYQTMCSICNVEKGECIIRY